MNENISHFLLKHDVHYGGEYEGKEGEFLNFTMTYTSYYVRSCMAKKFLPKREENIMNIFYYPADEKFPLVDFVFVKMEKGKK